MNMYKEIILNNFLNMVIILLKFGFIFFYCKICVKNGIYSFNSLYLILLKVSI